MSILYSLRRVVWENDTRAGRAFDIAVQLLVFASIIEFSIETIPNLSIASHRLLALSEKVVTVAFTLEYILRITSAQKPLKYILSPFGFIDLLAIIPFYLGLAIDLRSLRAVRFIRLIRILKLVRYSQALERYRIAFSLIREELVIYMGSVAIVLYFGSVGIWLFEHDAQPDKFASIFHALWWSLATLTTVGYGDVFPITPGGKIFTGVIVLAGIGLVAVPSGLFASALSNAREVQTQGQPHKNSTTID